MGQYQLQAAVAEEHGPRAGLAVLGMIGADDRMTASLPEHRYLTLRAARLRAL